MSSPPVQVSSFSELLRAALGDQLDPAAETLLDMVSADIVFEFPYAPAGSIRRLAGKQAVADHLAKFAGQFQLDSFCLHAVHRSTDGVTSVVQFECDGQELATGRPYLQRYISVIRVENGHIIHYQDYWNPQIVLEAMGGVEAVARVFAHGAA